MPFFGKATKQLTSLERLDQMGSRYRPVWGSLHRVLAIIEDAASSDPPYMSPTRLEALLGMVTESAANLTEAQKNPRHHRSWTSHSGRARRKMDRAEGPKGAQCPNWL